MRARNLVYEALNYAAKQSRLRNLKIIFSAPNVQINRPLEYVIWIASRHSLVLHRQGYVLAMTGSAVEKDRAAMQNDFSEWTHLSVPSIICETPCASRRDAMFVEKGYTYTLSRILQESTPESRVLLNFA